MSDNPYQPPESAPPPALTTLDVPYAFRAGISLSYSAILFAVLMAGRVEIALSLFVQASKPMVFCLPIIVWLVIAFYDTKRRKELEAPPILWLVPLMVLPFAILAWGTIFCNPAGIGFQRWQINVLHAALGAQLLLAVVAIAVNSGRRSFAGAMAILMLLFAASSVLVAGSVVKGNWL
jgi:hypothetical protein